MLPKFADSRNLMTDVPVSLPSPEAAIGLFLNLASKAVARRTDLLDGVMSPDANCARCQLFHLTEECAVSYDDLFSGRILYEALFYDNLLQSLSSEGFPLSALYQVLLDCENDIIERFKSRSRIPSNRPGPLHTYRLVAAASLTVDVLLMRHHLLARYTA
jgi:hypothetical protein